MNRRSRTRILKAGVVYFLIIFALRWILGPIRVLWAVSRFGRIPAPVLEGIIMLIAMFVSARWIISPFEVAPALPKAIGIGLVALAILLPAELARALWLRGLPLREYVASFENIPGVISLVLFLLFAAMPALVTMIRRGGVGAAP
jgi:hypothetical protein